MLVVLVMAGIVALILVRTVRRDLAKYEQLMVDGNNLDMRDEAGWKLVTGDAFRAPPGAKTLAVQVGAGGAQGGAQRSLCLGGEGAGSAVVSSCPCACLP